MYPIPMSNPWLARPRLPPRIPIDPTVSVKLYSWSSEEFFEEHALVYTSRSYPSHTCISHWRSNRNKLLFTLQDCLCVGNPVRIEMEIKSERDNRGLYVIQYYEFRPLSGKFIASTNRPGQLHAVHYREKFRPREGDLEYYSIEDGNEADINFITGLVGGPGLAYSINIHCDPFKGIEVDLDGPECYFGDPLPMREKRFIGYCLVEHVGGKPPRNVLEKMMIMITGESKEEKKGNKVDGASSSSSPASSSSSPALPSSSSSSSSSSSTTTQSSSTIMNSGITRGSLNGSNFEDCRFDFGRLLEKAVQGLSI